MAVKRRGVEASREPGTVGRDGAEPGPDGGRDEPPDGAERMTSPAGISIGPSTMLTIPELQLVQPLSWIA